MEKEKLRPKRRFAGFTDDWEQRKLSEMSDSFEYGLNAAAKDFDGVHKYIRITDIDDSSHVFLQNGITSPDFNLINADNYKLQKGDILFARTGASVGKSYIYKQSDGLVYYAGFLIRARINSKYDSQFVFQNTLTDSYNSFIKITSQRSGQPGVNAQEYGSFTILVPDKDEQGKIGNFFARLDNAITLNQQKLEKMKAVKLAYLSEMFPRGGECIPKRRFVGFTDPWEQCKLGDTVQIIMGQSPHSENYTDNPNDHVLVQGNSDMKNGRVIPRVWTTQITKKAYINDLILSVRAPVGDVGKTDYNVVLGRGVAAIKGNEFIFQTLTRFQQNGYWNKLSTGSTFESINSADIKEALISLPDEREQWLIGDFFMNLDNLITLQQRKLEKLQDLKKAYLNDMFV